MGTMNKPSLYSRASRVQRHDAKEIVTEYASILATHSSGKQSLLDVGCGSGDVLMEILVPGLAQGYTQISGTDKSPKMVDYSAKCYGNLDGVDFKELDIETELLPLEYHDHFDRVTSFYCLHWIQDQRLSLENIFKSLRENGDCLLVFLGSNSAFDVYRVLSRDPRWKGYIKDLKGITSPLLDHPQIEEEYASLMRQAGFRDPKVVVKTKSFGYEGIAKFKENMKAINVFPLPHSEYEEYFDALCDCFRRMGLSERIPGTDDHRYFLKYRLVIAYAKKCE